MLKRGEKCNVELSSEQIILLRLLVGSVAGLYERTPDEVWARVNV